MLCPLCGKNTVYKKCYKHTAKLAEPYESVDVENVQVISCYNCNESFLDDKACRQIEKAITNKYPNYFKKRIK